jgi:hypothetical protein
LKKRYSKIGRFIKKRKKNKKKEERKERRHGQYKDDENTFKMGRERTPVGISRMSNTPSEWGRHIGR